MIERVEAVLFDFTGVVADIRPALIGESGPDWILEPFDDVIEAIVRLKQAGVPTCLVSNNDREALLRDAKNIDFDAMFNSMVFSSDTGVGKPDRRIYLRAADAIATSTELCLFVDDVASNVDAAIETGMQGMIADSRETVVRMIDELLLLQ